MNVKGRNCIFCYKLLDTDSVNVTEDVLDLFKFVIKTINATALQNATICTACLKQISEAGNFKISYLVKQASSNGKTRQQESNCDEQFVTCYVCKNATKPNSAMPLFNSCYDNVVKYMVRDMDSDNLQICDDCHEAALNFDNVTQFLSIYDLNKTVNIQLNSETVTDQDKFKISIANNCLLENNNVHIVSTKEIKEEIEESNENNQIQEFDLKMNCDAGPSSSRFWSLSRECQERSSILSCPENVRDTYVSNLTSVANIEVDHKIFSNGLENEKSVKNLDEMFQAKHTNDLYQHAIIHKSVKETVKMFKCENCEYQTSNKYCLKEHALIHKNIHEVEMFKCDNCSYQTKRKQDLKKHAVIHIDINEVKLLKCQHCQYQTRSKYCLKKHALIHKDVLEVTMYKCENCEFRTKHKSDIKRHALIHKNVNEVKLFKCSNCLYQTKRKDTLNKHMLIHKNNNEVTMFKCQNCEFQTKHKTYLTQHALVHKDINEVEVFTCPICQYQTKRKGHLKQHAIVHKDINEIEIFKCQDCPFQTKRKGHLKIHMLIHKNISEVERMS